MVTRLLKKRTIVLAAMLWIGATILVAGQAFGAPWAGGAGFRRDLRVRIVESQGEVRVERFSITRTVVQDMMMRRGEIIRTGSDGRALIVLDDGTRIALDANTDLELVSLAPSDLTFRFPRGRMIVARDADFGNVVFTTNGTESGFRKGKASFVNYDFKETVSVIPLEKTVVGVVTNGGGTVTTTPVEIHETDPVTIADMIFDPAISAAKDFYEWSMKLLIN